MSTAQLIPLAIPMMAGPQILSAIIFVTAENPVKVSLAYVAAVAIAVAIGILIFCGLASVLGSGVSLNSSSDETAAGKVIEIALVALLLVASLKAYLGGRRRSRQSGWESCRSRARAERSNRVPPDPADAERLRDHADDSLHLKGNDLPYWHDLALVAATTLIAGSSHASSACTIWPGAGTRSTRANSIHSTCPTTATRIRRLSRRRCVRGSSTGAARLWSLRLALERAALGQGVEEPKRR